jgi:hypothetical protein
MPTDAGVGSLDYWYCLSEASTAADIDTAIADFPEQTKSLRRVTDPDAVFALSVLLVDLKACRALQRPNYKPFRQRVLWVVQGVLDACTAAAGVEPESRARDDRPSHAPGRGRSPWGT